MTGTLGARDILCFLCRPSQRGQCAGVSGPRSTDSTGAVTGDGPQVTGACSADLVPCCSQVGQVVTGAYRLCVQRCADPPLVRSLLPLFCLGPVSLSPSVLGLCCTPVGPSATSSRAPSTGGIPGECRCGAQATGDCSSVRVYLFSLSSGISGADTGISGL